MVEQQDLVLNALLQLKHDVGALGEAVRGLHNPNDCPGIKAVQRDIDVLAKALKEETTTVTDLRITKAKVVGALLCMGLTAGASGGVLERLLFP